MDTGKQYNIIYVEDDPEIVELVSLILGRSGYKISGFCNGQQGLDNIISKKPDLVLLDLMIPDIDGWDIYQKLKDNEATSDIPIIIISAKALPIDQVIGLHVAHVDGYITKPFLPQDILNSVEKALTSCN
jgi:two-component system, OmpR family, response regulator VicR